MFVLALQHALFDLCELLQWWEDFCIYIFSLLGFSIGISDKLLPNCCVFVCIVSLVWCEVWVVGFENFFFVGIAVEMTNGFVKRSHDDLRVVENKLKQQEWRQQQQHHHQQLSLQQQTLRRGRQFLVDAGENAAETMPRKVARRDSTRGFVQEVIVGSGDAIAEVPARTSALEQEGNLLQLQDSLGKNRVEGGKKESREEEQRKQREKKEEDLKDRNDRRMEAMPALPNLPEQRGADRDERKRAKAEKEKEKEKVREKDWGRDEEKGTHREKRDKIDKERESELNHQRGHLDKEDRDEKEEMHCCKTHGW